MTRSRPARTRTQQQGRDRGRVLTDEFVQGIEALRLDFGHSARALARAAGISHSAYSQMRSGRISPSVDVMARLAAAVGGRLALSVHQGNGPVIRDHPQAAMLQALAASLDSRWRTAPEVNVFRPVRGVIDIVLDDPDAALVVAGEAQSELRRIEQQVRWSNAKADALADAREAAASHVQVSKLLLRSTAATRQVVAAHADLLAAAYPAGHGDAVASLLGKAPWPGPALVWCEVANGAARILDRPPRGVRAPH
jgi:transcriptional regulator with XRE-family HTH domain